MKRVHLRAETCMGSGLFPQGFHHPGTVFSSHLLDLPLTLEGVDHFLLEALSVFPSGEQPFLVAHLPSCLFPLCVLCRLILLCQPSPYGFTGSVPEALLARLQSLCGESQPHSLSTYTDDSASTLVSDICYHASSPACPNSAPYSIVLFRGSPENHHYQLRNRGIPLTISLSPTAPISKPSQD